MVDALEAAGAVRRERDPGDRRIVRVWITEAGRTVAGASRSADTLPPPPDELALRRWLYQVVATARGDW